MLINNVIKKANYGVTVLGTLNSKNTNFLLENNLIGVTSNTESEYIGFYGLDLNGVYKGAVRGNEIANVINSNSYYMPYGINVGIGNDSMIIINNVIRNIKKITLFNYGACAIGINSISNGVKIINNLIYDISGGSAAVYGIKVKLWARS